MGLRVGERMSEKELEAVCRGAGFSFEEMTEEVEEGHFQHLGWYIGAPGSRRYAHLHDHDDIQRALQTKFIDWRPFSGFNAMFSPSLRRIEAEIEIKFVPFLNRKPLSDALRALGLESLPIRFPDTADGVQVSIATASPELMFWRTASPSFPSIGDEAVPSLTIRGLREGFGPEETLLNLGNAALWSLWSAANVSARLKRYQRLFQPFTFGPRLIEPELPLRAPEAAPASRAFELFVGGEMKDSSQERFLAFYRVLEFYFGRSTIHAKQRELRRAGVGAAVADADLLKILERVEPSFQELTAFKSVFADVFPGDSLFEFVEAREELRELYIDELGITRPDFGKEVAKRLYETRCSIVHAKEKGEFLLPTDEKHVDLHQRLMKVAAARTLRHFSSPVRQDAP